MITTLKIAALWSVAMGSSVKNPVKSGASLIMYALFSLTIFFYESGSPWFSSLLGLLFVGGILMVFMILSSLMPNEKVMKHKFIPVPMMSFLAFLAPWSGIPAVSVFGSLKYAMGSGNVILMVVALILFYFFSFIFVMSQESWALRSLS